MYSFESLLAGSTPAASAKINQYGSMMLDFSTVEAPVHINTDFVLSKVSDVAIFRQYFGDFEPYKKTYRSVFRKDRTPSTGFYFGESGKLKYKDLGTGESWDCFAFVAKLHNISYYEAVKKIACDFGLVKCEGVPLERKILHVNEKYDRKVKAHTEIQIIAGEWTKDHKDYWKQYGITREELEFYNVYPVEQLFINKNYIGNPHGELRFAYLVKTPRKEYMKIYTPYAKDGWKWVSNVPINIPFGWDTLSCDSKVVFLGKSLKDMILLRKIFPSVLSSQNESESALSDNLVKYLKKTFEKRIIVWDNDQHGLESSKKFSDRGFDLFHIPTHYLDEQIKDPADFVKCYGLNKLKQLFKQKGLLNG